MSTMIDPRERITSGFNRARLQLEAKRGAVPLVILLIGALLSLGAWLTILKNVGRQVYAGTKEIGFQVADASAVVGGGRQDVRFKGVPVGTIDEIKLRNGRAFITAKIYDEYLPIYRDARVNLRPNTALEDMYLDIVDRGRRGAGEASVSDPIGAQRVRVGVQVEDVLQALDPDVRGRFATLLDQLGRGFAGRGDELRAAFVQAVPFLQAADRVSDQLARRTRLTRTLVTNTAAITDELGRRDRTLKSLVADAGTTLKTLEDGTPDLDATLRELPGTLSSVDGSFTTVRAALPDVDDALVALRAVGQRLPGGLRAARQLSSDARPALSDLRRPVAELTGLARYLPRGTQLLAQTVGELRPQVPAIDHVTKVAGGCSTALQGFFQWTPSVMKLGDARGASVRGEAVVGIASTAAIKDPTVIARDSCAPGRPIGGEPGAAGAPTTGANR